MNTAILTSDKRDNGVNINITISKGAIAKAINRAMLAVSVLAACVAIWGVSQQSDMVIFGSAIVGLASAMGALGRSR